MIDIMIKNYRIIFILKYLTIQFFNTYIKNQKSFLKIKLFFFKYIRIINITNILKIYIYFLFFTINLLFYNFAIAWLEFFFRIKFTREIALSQEKAKNAIPCCIAQDLTRYLYPCTQKQIQLTAILDNWNLKEFNHTFDLPAPVLYGNYLLPLLAQHSFKSLCHFP